VTVGVLFDLEDTLVKTPWSDCRHVIEFRHQTRAALIQFGIPYLILEGVERSTVMRNRAGEYAKRKFSQEELQEFHEKMERFLSDYELDSASKSTVFPDTVETLERLRAKAVRMAIVTNTSAKAAASMLQRHGLKPYFDLIVTREDVEQLKPNPEGIFLAAGALGATKCFMVGDSVLDAIAAKSAGAVSVVVTREQDGMQVCLNGLSAGDVREAREYVEERKNVQADHVIESLIEILPLIVAEQRKT